MQVLEVAALALAVKQQWDQNLLLLVKNYSALVPLWMKGGITVLLKNVSEPGHEGYTLDAYHVSFCHVPQSNQQLNYIETTDPKSKFLCWSVSIKVIW